MSISVVIPAFNEEKYLGGVLAPLREVDLISQIIVVSDGSTDHTGDVARAWGVQVIELEQNQGKGGAMSVGISHTKEEIILFLDADLIGLTAQHIIDLVLPVLNDEADMTIGVFEHGRLATDMAQVIAPYLSGQRCIRKKWLQELPEIDSAGFGIETALTLYAYQHDLRVIEVTMPEMTHIMKEEKLGLIKGFAYRMKMYWEIAKNVRIGG
jgi:glycosyltransferase involved in cell wall biosynthesis